MIAAPRQFEIMSSFLNTDQIILDLDSRQAIGAQVKTRIGSNPEEYKNVLARYDDRFVVLIDGASDLGNVKTFRHKDNKRLIRIEPGLLSMHHITRTPASDIARHGNLQRHEILRISERANQMTRGSRFSVEEAGRRVGKKLDPIFSNISHD